MRNSLTSLLQALNIGYCEQEQVLRPIYNREFQVWMTAEICSTADAHMQSPVIVMHQQIMRCQHAPIHLAQSPPFFYI